MIPNCRVTKQEILEHKTSLDQSSDQ